MVNMEIQILSEGSLRIKSKRAAFVVDPADKSTRQSQDYAAAIVMARPVEELNISAEAVVIDRPGEYEIGGIKMNAVRADTGVLFSPVVDGIEVLLGKLSTLEKTQHKLKEQHMVIVCADEEINASFVSSLATGVVVFYGKYAKEAARSLGKDDIKNVSKYSISLEKLPSEVETIVLE